VTLHLRALLGRYAVARLAPATGWPHWAAWSRDFVSVSRTVHETTVICEASRVPPQVRAERDFVVLVVEGPLDFSEVGVLARITAPLAAAGVPILAVSTFDTDVLLVRDVQLAEAVSALERAGMRVSLADG
jgi:uncharacterized protein